GRQFGLGRAGDRRAAGVDDRFGLQRRFASVLDDDLVFDGVRDLRGHQLAGREARFAGQALLLDDFEVGLLFEFRADRVGGFWFAAGRHGRHVRVAARLRQFARAGVLDRFFAGRQFGLGRAGDRRAAGVDDRFGLQRRFAGVLDDDLVFDGVRHLRGHQLAGREARFAGQALLLDDFEVGLLFEFRADRVGGFWFAAGRHGRHVRVAARLRQFARAGVLDRFFAGRQFGLGRAGDRRAAGVDDRFGLQRRFASVLDDDLVFDGVRDLRGHQLAGREARFAGQALLLDDFEVGLLFEFRADRVGGFWFAA